MTTEDQSLLADLALRLAKSPEDVATEGLAYVLARSEVGRAQIQRLASEWTPVSLRPIISFQSQVADKDDARPDLEAHDAAGNAVVIFENKFWAGLTLAQPVAYMRRLERLGGALCFVAPAARLHLLWHELVERTEAAFGPVRVQRDEAEQRIAHVGERCGLVATSWGFLLGQLRTALEAQGDSALVADVRQLSGLAARMETVGFLPLTVSDLTAPTARHVLQFCDVVNAAVEVLLREPFASKKGLKATAGQGWYGHYVRLHGLGCQLAFEATMWLEHGRSPIWLRVFGPKWRYAVAVERVMARLLGHNACVPIREGVRMGVWTAIRLPEGRERDDVVTRVVEQVVAVAGALQELARPEAPDESPTEPDAG